MFKTLIDGCDPTRGSKFSACVDLCASEDITIGAGDTKLIGLGVAIDFKRLDFLECPYCGSNEMYQDRIAGHYCDDCGEQLDNNKTIDDFKSKHYLQLMLRSSLGKKGLILPNGVGIIDMDYKDEIKMIIHNPVEMIDILAQTGLAYEIKKGDRIAQITLLEHKAYLFGIESDVERDGGFGSTGK